MANFRGKIQTDLGLSKFSQYRPVGRVRADTSAKPVLDASARTFEALGNLSPTLMKLAAYQVGLQKEEIRSEEQKRFASASLEERRRFAEGEALEEEKQNPTFAGSNPWRRVIRQEIAGKHAAEVNLLSEIERRRDSLTDHDRSIEDIKSEMQSLQAEYRPDSLYGGRAYDASAAAVVQQNEGRFLAIRSRKQEAATAEAITTGIQDQIVLGAEGGVVDLGAIRDFLDRYHSLTGKSGRKFLDDAIESVAGIYDQRLRSGSISSEEYEDSIIAIYGVPDSMFDLSAESSQISPFDGGSAHAYQKDEETGELVPPKLRVQAIDSSGKTHFVVIPEDMSEQDFEAAVRGSAVYESFPTFVSEKDAQAFAANPERSLRPDGTQRKPAPTMSSLDNAQRRAALDKRLYAARDYDNAKYRENYEAAYLRLETDIKPRVASLVLQGKTFEEIKEEIYPLLAEIGEETGYALLVDAEQVHEEIMLRGMISREVEALGVSIEAVDAQLTSAAINGEASPLEIATAPGITKARKEQLLEFAKDSEGVKQAMINDLAPREGMVSTAIQNSRLRHSWRFSDKAYIGNLAIRFREEFAKRALDSIPPGEFSDHTFRDALREQAKPGNVQEIVDFLVADDIEPRDPNADVIGLLRNADVLVFLDRKFEDEEVWNTDGRMSFEEQRFYNSMLGWVTEYRGANPDAVPPQMVSDFIKDDGGFEAFHKKAAEADAVPEQAQLTPRRQSLMNERLESARKAEEEALADFPERVLPAPPSKSKINFMLKAREDIPALRQDLGPISGWEESDEYNKDSTVSQYRKGKQEQERIQREQYEARDVIGQKNKARPMSYDFFALPDKMVAGLIEKGDTGYGRFGFNYGDILLDTLQYRMAGGLIDGKPSYITPEELESGELRMPYRNVLVPVPKAELNPREYLMVADKEQLESYTSEDWMTLYGNLDDTVKESLDRYVEAGAAADIPELLYGLQEDLLYLHYRIDLEK